MARSPSYSTLQIALHWIVALLVGAAWLYADGMGRLLNQKLEGTYSGGTPVHVLLGLAVLAFVVLRLVVRMSSGTPGAPEGTSDTHAAARHWGHVVLYVLLFAVPLGGVAAWFFGVRQVGEIHGLAANGLLILAGVHAAIAIWHQWGRHDGTLMRMLKPGA